MFWVSDKTVMTSEPAGNTKPKDRFDGRFAKPRVPEAPRAYVWTSADTWSTLLVALVAFITRFIGLTSATASGTPVFDEKHYVPQAYDMVKSWINPLTGGIESNPGYGLVVHPPLAKQIEALGEIVFGYSPMGWRIMAALFGVGTVMLIMELARRVSHSWSVATFAGVIAVADGVLLIASRFGMLDIFQVLFIVAAALAFVLDRQQMNKRMHAAYEQGLIQISGKFGPRLGFRWWRFGCGVLLGLALSVKWSGLYYMAFFGVLTVCMDWWLRVRYGVKKPFAGMLVRDAFPAFASLVIWPVALYFWSWRAWFASETSVYRHAKVDGTLEDFSPLKLLPESLSGFFYYHSSVLEFHGSLTTSGGHSHPWDSKPWSWLVAGRPILYFSSTDLECAAGSCRRMIYMFGTPAIWWLTVPVLAWALWALVVRRDVRYLIPFIAFMAGFLPWLASYDRQMYFFYATTLVPFTIVMIALTLGLIASAGKQLTAKWATYIGARNFTTGQMVVVGYLALVLAMFAYFSPILYGYMIPDSWYESLMWLPSWR